MVDCCELLKRYDTNKNGKIDKEEYLKAITDYTAGRITREELQIIADAYEAGSINAVCPRCYEEQPTQKKATLHISTNPSGANVYVDGVYKGTT